jgi:hypothetical protein
MQSLTCTNRTNVDGHWASVLAHEVVLFKIIVHLNAQLRITSEAHKIASPRKFYISLIDSEFLIKRFIANTRSCQGGKCS